MLSAPKNPGTRAGLNPESCSDPSQTVSYTDRALSQFLGDTPGRQAKGHLGGTRQPFVPCCQPQLCPSVSPRRWLGEGTAP